MKYPPIKIIDNRYDWAIKEFSRKIPPCEIDLAEEVIHGDKRILLQLDKIKPRMISNNWNKEPEKQP